jgi:hypothetical protein
MPAPFKTVTTWDVLRHAAAIAQTPLAPGDADPLPGVLGMVRALLGQHEGELSPDMTDDMIVRVLLAIPTADLSDPTT